MVNHLFISLFRCINFSLLIALAVYLLKKKGIPFIKKGIKNKQKETEFLSKRYEDACLTHDHLVQEIKEQEDTIHTYMVKIDQWRSEEENKKVLFIQNQEKHTQSLLQKARLIAEHTAAQKELNSLLPPLVAEVEEELRQYFSNKKNRELFMHSLLKKIEQK